MDAPSRGTAGSPMAMATRARKKDDGTPRAVAVLNPPPPFGPGPGPGHVGLPKATMASGTPRGAWAHLQKSLEDWRERRPEEFFDPMYRACDNAIYQVESGVGKFARGVKSSAGKVGSDVRRVMHVVGDIQAQCAGHVWGRIEELQQRGQETVVPFVEGHLTVLSEKGQVILRNVSGIFERVDGERSRCPRCKGSGLLVQRKAWDAEELQQLEEPCWFCEGVGVMPILDLNGYMVARAPALVRTRDPPLKPRAHIRVQLYLGKYPGTRTRITTHRLQKETWWQILYLPSAVPSWLIGGEQQEGTLLVPQQGSQNPLSRDRSSPTAVPRGLPPQRPSRPGSATSPRQERGMAGGGAKTGTPPPSAGGRDSHSRSDPHQRYRTAPRTPSSYAHKEPGSARNGSVPRSDSPTSQGRSRTAPGTPPAGSRYSGPPPDLAPSSPSSHDHAHRGPPPPSPPYHRRSSSANGTSSRHASPSKDPSRGQGVHPTSSARAANGHSPPGTNGYGSAPQSRSTSPAPSRPPAASGAGGGSLSATETGHHHHPNTSTRFEERGAGRPESVMRGHALLDGVTGRSRSGTPSTSRGSRRRGAGGEGGTEGGRSPRRGERNRIREKAERDAMERARRVQRSVSPRSASDLPDPTLGPTSFSGGEGQTPFGVQNNKWNDAVNDGWLGSGNAAKDTKEKRPPRASGGHDSPSFQWLGGSKSRAPKRSGSVSQLGWADDVDMKGKSPKKGT